MEGGVSKCFQSPPDTFRRSTNYLPSQPNPLPPSKDGQTSVSTQPPRSPSLDKEGDEILIIY